jgi:hypothetical protein
LSVDSYTGGTASLSWAPSAESGVASYVVAYGPPSDRFRHRFTVTRPHGVLPQIAPGSIVSVKAVNARGFEGWDWAKIAVGASSSSRVTQ